MLRCIEDKELAFARTTADLCVTGTDVRDYFMELPDMKVLLGSVNNGVA